MLERLLRFHRCIRHVPTRQLARRGWLTIKRKIVRRFPLAAPSWRPLRQSATPPLRFMPPRSDFIAKLDGRYQLRQLNKSYDLTPPIDWRLQAQTKPNHLDRLAIHYHEFLESLPFEVGLAAILDWIKNNPWNAPDAWKLGWNCYALSIRAICWMQWLAEYQARLDESTRIAILGSLSGQLRYLKANLETDIGGNHLLKNLSCLLWAGAYFDDSESRAFATTANRLLQTQLQLQFLADGMHYELSPAYHCQVFVDLLHCRASLAARNQLNSTLEQRLLPAAQIIADLTHPDQCISLFSDGGLTMAYPPSQCLDAYTAATGNRVTRQSSFAHRASGYFGFRGQSTYFLADCGPSCADSLPAHGHGDMLAFEWDVFDKRIVVDQGVFEYESGELRAKSRSARSHNTVTVGERDQCEFVGSFRVGRRAHAHCGDVTCEQNRFALEGHHAGFSNGADKVIHRRRFEVQDGSVKVRDTVEGNGNEPAIARLLLHDACKVEQISENQVQIERDGALIRLFTTANLLRITPTRWFPNFGEARDTHQIELHYGAVPCTSGFELTLESTGKA